MNKKTLTVTSVALVLMIVIGIILVFLGSKHGTVYVDGQLARDIHISRWKSSNGTTMNIPLLATLTHLDYKITQQDANIYELKKTRSNSN